MKNLTLSIMRLYSNLNVQSLKLQIEDIKCNLKDPEIKLTQK